MSRFFFLVYGTLSYLFAFVSLLYAIGFVSNLGVPKAIDGPATAPFTTALITNLVLLAIFAIQHSVMARQGFKRWWTKYVPEPIERSTYVLLSTVALDLLMWKWEPMGGLIWSVSSPILSGMLTAICLLGFAIVLGSTFLVNHLDLFGVRQVIMYFRKQPYTPVKFTGNTLYKYVRHPLYLGFLIGFWAAPIMTFTHLVFAIMVTGYIFVGIYLEEKDLTSFFGETYLNYKRNIPMIIPFLKFGKKPAPVVVPASKEKKVGDPVA